MSKKKAGDRLWDHATKLSYSIGYPVVTLGFGFKTYVSYRMRRRRQKEVQKVNEYYYEFLREALPPGPVREEAFNPHPTSPCKSLYYMITTERSEGLLFCCHCLRNLYLLLIYFSRQKTQQLMLRCRLLVPVSRVSSTPSIGQKIKPRRQLRNI